MTVVLLPETAIRWRTATWRLGRADAVQEFMSGATQVTAFSKAIWSGQIELPSLNDDAGALRKWRSALARLSALGNTFEAIAPGAESGPSTGYAGSTPVVNGAGQLGLSIVVSGASPNAALVNAGDYLSVIAGGWRELKIVTSDVVTDGTGAATIAFEPALRNAPNDSARVDIFTPKGAFRLADASAAWRLSPNGIGNIVFDVEEAFAPGAGSVTEDPQLATFDSGDIQLDSTQVTWDAA